MLLNPLKCNLIITKTMGNSMSFTHIQAKLFLSQPTMLYVCVHLGFTATLVVTIYHHVCSFI